MAFPQAFRVTIPATAQAIVVDGDSTAPVTFLIRNIDPTLSIWVGPSTVQTTTGFELKAGEAISGGLLPVAGTGAQAIYGISASSVIVEVIVGPAAATSGTDTLADWKTGRITPWQLQTAGPAGAVGPGGGAVQSVNAKVGVVSLVASDVGALAATVNSNLTALATVQGAGRINLNKDVTATHNALFVGTSQKTGLAANQNNGEFLVSLAAGLKADINGQIYDYQSGMQIITWGQGNAGLSVGAPAYGDGIFVQGYDTSWSSTTPPFAVNIFAGNAQLQTTWSSVGTGVTYTATTMTDPSATFTDNALNRYILVPDNSSPSTAVRGYVTSRTGATQLNINTQGWTVTRPPADNAGWEQIPTTGRAGDGLVCPVDGTGYNIYNSSSLGIHISRYGAGSAIWIAEVAGSGNAGVNDALLRLSAAAGSTSQIISWDLAGAQKGYIDINGEIKTVRYSFIAGPKLLAGNGAPEGVLTAPVGSIVLRPDGGASTTLYVKESGAGNTGWIAYGPPAYPITVARGGTGVATLTAHGVLIGEGTGNVVATAAPTSGQLLFGQSNVLDPLWASMSGDATIGGAGVITIAAGAVTLAKQANLAANSIQGNNTGAGATPIALTAAQTKTLLAIANTDVSGLGTASTHAATDFDVAGAAAAVTPTTLGLVIGTNTQAYSEALDDLAALGDIADQTFLGNNSGSAAAPLALTPAQAKAVLALIAADIPALPASKITSGSLAIAQGGTAQVSAAAARAASGLNIESLHTVADADYTILATDRVTLWSSIAAARVATLPAASALNAGQRLIVGDESGSASATNTITITRAGADTINGATTEVIKAPYGMRILVSDGASKWTFDGGVLRAGNNLSDVQSAATARTNLSVQPTDNPTFTTLVTTPALSVSGLTGAVHPTRYVGATTTGAAPTTGTFAVGDFVIVTFATIATVFVCTTAGTPGTWAEVSSVAQYNLGIDTLWTTKGDTVVATASATASRLAVGTFGQTILADSTPSQGVLYGQPEDLRSKYLKPTNSYETYARIHGVANIAALATGTVTLVAIALPKNKVITNVAFTSNVTGAGTPTNWWFSLCDNTFTTLRSTADQLTTAWGATTVKTLALSSTFTTTYEGLYYLAVMVKATTVPTLGGTSITVGSGTTPRIGLTGITGQTTAPADGTNLATAPVTLTAGIWAYVT